MVDTNTLALVLGVEHKRCKHVIVRLWSRCRDGSDDCPHHAAEVLNNVLESDCILLVGEIEPPDIQLEGSEE